MCDDWEIDSCSEPARSCIETMAVSWNECKILHSAEDLLPKMYILVHHLEALS